jgi:glutamate carboxypeptidase
MTDEAIQGVSNYLEAKQSEMVALLLRLASCESPSDRPSAIAPVLDMLTSELEETGMLVHRLPGHSSGGLLYARPRERRKRQPAQLLIGHCDTVWPLGTLAQMPVEVRGDAIWGPGVFDMKGGLVQMIYSLRALRDLRLDAPADCVVIINSDEEVGSRDSTPLIRRVARCAVRAFVLEPAFGRSGKLKTARKASGSFTLTVKGRAAHAGINPEDGVSAILEMSYQVQRLFALNDPSRGITVNVGTIDGGLRPNVVAPVVTACIDVRARTTADAAQLEAAIRGLKPVLPKSEIEVKGGIEQAPMEPGPRNQALWTEARVLGARVGLSLEEAWVGGASDGNTTSQYTATLDGLGAVGDGAHAAHEHILIPQMVERSTLLTLLLLSPPRINAAAAPPEQVKETQLTEVT